MQPETLNVCLVILYTCNPLDLPLPRYLCAAFSVLNAIARRHVVGDGEAVMSWLGVQILQPEQGGPPRLSSMI